MFVTVTSPVGVSNDKKFKYLSDKFILSWKRPDKLLISNYILEKKSLV